MKNEASRGQVEMDPALAEALIEWRSKTPYPADSDWVFASPYTKGKSPFWCDTALKNHVKPGAKAAGINKVIGWHTFRRSCASIMSEAGADKKIIQEILRHASGKMTDLYISKSSKAKRSALSSVTGIFAAPVPKKA
jgi:integrase